MFALSTEVEQMLLHTYDQGPGSSRGKSAFDYKLSLEPPRLSATITDLCNEPLFFGSYLSDEEDFSAPEEDNMSFSTSTSSSQFDDCFDDFEATFPELLAEECSFVEQQCNKAQAVMLVAAGRPKMIQLSKVNIPQSAPVLARPSSSSSRIIHRRESRKAIHIPSISREHSRNGSASSSINNSMPCTPEIPSTPLLENGLVTPSSACTPLTPRTPNPIFRLNPMASPTPSDKSATPTSSHFRSHNEYHLEAPNMIKRSVSHMHTVTISSVRRPSSPLTVPHTAPLNVPSIYSYNSSTKKVERGTNERPPFFDLPPYLSGEAMHTVKPTRPWALRKDSFGSVHRETSKTMKTRIRKVESAFGLNTR